MHISQKQNHQGLVSRFRFFARPVASSDSSTLDNRRASLHTPQLDLPISARGQQTLCSIQDYLVHTIRAAERGTRQGMKHCVRLVRVRPVSSWRRLILKIVHSVSGGRIASPELEVAIRRGGEEERGRLMDGEAPHRKGVGSPVTSLPSLP